MKIILDKSNRSLYSTLVFLIISLFVVISTGKLFYDVTVSLSAFLLASMILFKIYEIRGRTVFYEKLWMLHAFIFTVTLYITFAFDASPIVPLIPLGFLIHSINVGATVKKLQHQISNNSIATRVGYDEQGERIIISSDGGEIKESEIFKLNEKLWKFGYVATARTANNKIVVCVPDALSPNLLRYVAAFPEKNLEALTSSLNFTYFVDQYALTTSEVALALQTSRRVASRLLKEREYKATEDQYKALVDFTNQKVANELVSLAKANIKAFDKLKYEVQLESETSRILIIAKLNGNVVGFGSNYEQISNMIDLSKLELILERKRTIESCEEILKTVFDKQGVEQFLVVDSPNGIKNKGRDNGHPIYREFETTEQMVNWIIKDLKDII